MNTQELIARGVCVEDGKILLAHYKDKDYYFLPGGHVEIGESVREALEREIDEELKLSITAGNIVSIFEHSWKDSEEEHYELNFLIPFSIPKDTDLISHVEHLTFEWISIEDFSSINFLPAELKEGIGKLIQKETIPPFQSSLQGNWKP